MRRFVPLVVSAVFALPSTALAQGSNCSSQNQTYGSQDCQVISIHQSRTTGTTTTNTGSLPFTGLDVGLLAAGGGTLLGAGLIVRRMSRSAE